MKNVGIHDEEEEALLRIEEKPTEKQAKDPSWWWPRIQKKLDAMKKRGFTFLLVGRTGVGKSSTVNQLLGKEIAPVGKFEPETRSVTKYPTELFGTTATVVDTPGLCDDLEEKGNDEAYLGEIRSALQEIDCMLFVTQLSETRVRRDEKDAVRLITEAFGPSIWKTAVIVFTFADKVSPDEYTQTMKARAGLVRDEVARWSSSGIARRIPAVAVSNFCDKTPDGEPWLPELYTTVFERMSKRGLIPFVMATAPRTMSRKEIKVSTKRAANEPMQRTPDMTDYSRPIVLTNAQESRIKSRLTAGGAIFGSVLGGFLGGPIGAAVGAVVGGGVGRLLSKLFG